MNIKKNALIIFCCVSFFCNNSFATLYFERNAKSELIFTISTIWIGAIIGLTITKLNSVNAIVTLREKLNKKFISNYRKVTLEACGRKEEPQGFMEWMSSIADMAELDMNKIYEIHCESPRERDIFKELLAEEKQYYSDWIATVSNISLYAITFLAIINFNK